MRRSVVVRAREFCQSCAIYGAQDCVSEGFPSRAHLRNSGAGFEETPEEIIRTWERLGPTDPAGSIVEWIRSVRPEWVLTLDPDHGMYGHPEHRAAAMLVLRAVRSVQPGWRGRVFAAENRFGSLPADLDPGPVTLRFPAEVPCSPFQTCWEVGADAVAAYASQKLTDFRAVPKAERFTNLRELK